MLKLRSHTPSQPARVWPVLVVLVAAMAALGSWTLTSRSAVRATHIFLPEALGVPTGLPALRAWPLGQTAWPIWLADIAGAVVLVLIVGSRLKAATSKFGPTINAVVLGLVCANLVRLAWWSVTAQHSLKVFLGALVLSVVFSMFDGLVFGLVLALVHVATGRAAPRPPQAPVVDAPTDLPTDDAPVDGQREPENP